MLWKKKEKAIYAPLADVHCHILPTVDDGARDMDTALEMIRLSYEEGVRLLVFTPHVREPWLDMFRRHFSLFEQVREKAAERYPDLLCYLGSEVYFTRELYEEHREKFRRINETDYLLVEFSTSCGYADIEYAVGRLVSDGYLPIIAHVERYAKVFYDPDALRQIRRMGACLQMNASTVTHPFDRSMKKRVEQTLKEGAVSFLASDAHDPLKRRPAMQDAYQTVCALCGEAYAKRICYDNAAKMTEGKWLN